MIGFETIVFVFTCGELIASTREAQCSYKANQNQPIPTPNHTIRKNKNRRFAVF
jgi:hypothetical protein